MPQGFTNIEATTDRPDLQARLKRAVLPQGASLLDALRVLDACGLQMALNCDLDGTLNSIVTDGDVRRALLMGATLQCDVAPFLRRDFVRISVMQGRVEALDLMQSLRIKQIPIVDEEGKLCGLHLLDELVSPTRLPNEAVLLAGGKGTRLRPITENIPKPMLKVAGRPILERLVLHLSGHGVRKIYLATNYMAHVVQQHFQDGERFGCQISYLSEEQPLGTAGPLGLLSTIPEYPLLVVNGDLVTQFDVQAMLTCHDDSENVLTIGVKIYSHQIPFGCVTVEDKRVKHLVEKPRLSRLVNAGIYVLDPSVLRRITPNTTYQMTDLINDVLASGGKVGVFELTDDWIDVGQKESLDLARGGI